ncbi:MAG: protein kinase [Clostridia bacterium]|nr:protein kinase [Clostridia bacterium]
MKRCYSCFKEYESEFSICPYCGQIEITKPIEPIQLRPGTVLQGRYILGEAVGAGGFGIVYKAWDSKLETIIAVKEFFVSRMMTRAEGESKIIVSKKSQVEFEYRKERFLAEARNMAKFGTHRSIPNVFEYFEENGTAYIVMELLQGSALNSYLGEKNGILDIDLAIMIANEVGNALKSLHEHKIIHRDVAPDNIFICSGRDIKIKLMDLGAAKLADSTDEVIDIILKPGYSPTEQYDNTKNIGPWSDIYALGATLYAMLTGIKPDESTNRKINDEVVPPNVINPQISENLNNTIMKAMAVEKHMRFKTVDEFLSALNGERKVITLAKERKKRKTKRLCGIAAACLALSIVGTVVMNTFSDKKAEQYLDDAEIDLWFAVADGATEDEVANEYTAVMSVADNFHETFPNVDINLRAFPESQYTDALEKAASEGNLPTLFESTSASEQVLSAASDLDNVIKSEQFKNSLFLDQYDNYYNNRKQMPLAIEVPMACIITRGEVTLEYEKDYFDSVSDFGNVSVAVDSDKTDIVNKNFGLEGTCSDEGFMKLTENTSPVMLSSTMSMDKIRTLVNYRKDYIYYNGETKCEFVYEWSIGTGSENEIKAAERLLSWMLGNVYQSSLMISECGDNWMIPVNKTCFNAKLEAKATEFGPIKNIYQNFIFVRED